VHVYNLSRQESTWAEPFSTEVQQSYRRGYYAAAAFSDDKFGELLLTLDETGFTNSTIVVMTAEYVALT
jgi:arylsulfatase A-like enzyme